MKEKVISFCKKNELKIEISAVILLTLISVSLAFNNNAWMDEIYSMRWTKFSWVDMMRRLISDVHPPLYYIMLKIVNFLSGNNLIVAKLFSVIPTAIYLVLGITFVNKQFGRKAMFFWWTFVTCAPCMLEKTVEVRMYTWTTLFCILAAIFMFYLFQEPTRKKWVLFTLFSLAAAYTHYYGLATMIFVYLAVGVYFLFMKNWKNVKNFIICCFATIVGYLPWLGIAIKQITAVNGDYWIDAPSSRLSYIRELLESSFPYSEKVLLALIVILSVCLFVLFLKKRKMELYWALAVCAPIWCIMILGQVYGVLIRPVLISRYLIMAFCLMVMGLAVVWKYINKYLLIVPIVYLLCVGVVEYQDVYADEYQRLTEMTCEFSKENIRKGDKILYDIASLDNSILYYVPDAQAVALGDYNLYEEEYDTIWFFAAYNNSLDLETLDNHSIKYECKGQFGFDNIYFTIYRLTRE